MTRGTPKWQTKRAKQLRHDMTFAEVALWRALRAHRFKGVGFRRQTPIGPFIVDFVSHRQRLVIEVDGGQHSTSQSDPSRDKWLESQGYEVLRFWNNDVLSNMNGVLERIAEHVTPPSLTLPQSGGGDRTATSRNKRA